MGKRKSSEPFDGSSYWQRNGADTCQYFNSQHSPLLHMSSTSGYVRSAVGRDDHPQLCVVCGGMLL